MHQLDELFQRKHACFHQLGIQNREGSFQTDYTHQALFQTSALFLCGVGSVVCRNHANRAVENTGNQCFSVLLAADGGIHFKTSVLL